MRHGTADSTGYLRFHPTAQCIVHAVKGVACRASPSRARLGHTNNNTTPACSHALPCLDRAFASCAFYACGCTSPFHACLSAHVIWRIHRGQIYRIDGFYVCVCAQLVEDRKKASRADKADPLGEYRHLLAAGTVMKVWHVLQFAVLALSLLP